MTKMLCLTTLSEITFDDSQENISCELSCIYYGACNDDFKSSKAPEKSQTVSKKVRKELEDLPEETELEADQDYTEDGFQIAMEERDIVDSMKIDEEAGVGRSRKPADEDSDTEEKQAQRQSTNEAVQGKQKRVQKKKESTTSLDDIEL